MVSRADQQNASIDASIAQIGGPIPNDAPICVARHAIGRTLLTCDISKYLRTCRKWDLIWCIAGKIYDCGGGKGPKKLDGLSEESVLDIKMVIPERAYLQDGKRGA